jgi:hypothetical protein
LHIEGGLFTGLLSSGGFQPPMPQPGYLPGNDEQHKKNPAEIDLYSMALD